MAKDSKRRIVAEFSAKNKAKGVMAGFGRDMDTIGRTMRRMAVGALAVAGIGGLGYMLKKQMEVIDATAKLSDRLGMSTEALIGMQHGANIAGVQTETLNKALSTLSSRLGEVDMGVGQATYALEKLGLNYKDLIGLNMDEAIGIVADQIRNLSTQSEKAAAANYLFGKSGRQLLNLFEEGSEGVAKYQEEVRKLGLSFSRIDAAQVEAANDALTRARAVLTGLFRQATIELAPYIEALADKFVDVSTAGEGLGANVVNVFESMSLAAIRFGDVVHGLSAKFKAFQAGALEGAASILEIFAQMERFSPIGGGGKLGRWIVGAESPADMAKRYRERAEELMEKAGTAAVSTYGQENAVKRFYEGLRREADAWQVVYETKAKQRAETGFQEETEAQRKAADEIEKIRTEMWLKEEERAYHAMRAPIIEAEKEAMASAERRKRIAEDIAMSMAGSWSNAMDQMMFEGKKFWDAMEDMARSLLREIVNIIMYKKFAEPIAYGIMGLPIPGIGGGGGVGTVTPQAGATLARYQHGGIATRPHLAMVGEVPEAFVPLSGGRSIPVDLRGGGGEKSIDIHIHNEQGEDREISHVEQYVVSDQRIIDVFTRRAQIDGPLRRSIKQAAR